MPQTTLTKRCVRRENWISGWLHKLECLVEIRSFEIVKENAADAATLTAERNHEIIVAPEWKETGRKSIPPNIKLARSHHIPLNSHVDKSIEPSINQSINSHIHSLSLHRPFLVILIMLVGVFITGVLESLMKMDKVIFVVNVRRQIGSTAEPSDFWTIRIFNFKISEGRRVLMLIIFFELISQTN